MIRKIAAVVDTADLALPFLALSAQVAAREGMDFSVQLLCADPLAAPDLAPIGSLYVPEEILEREAELKRSDLERVLTKRAGPVKVRCIRDDVAWLAGDVSLERPLVDLFIASTTEAWDIRWLRKRVLETLLLSSGTPLLILPPDRALARLRHIVLGWKATRETVRAMRDVVDLAEPGARIDVVAVVPHAEPDARTTGALIEVEQYLTGRGFAVAWHTPPVDGTSEAEVLQSFTRECGADVLAVGGFGHSRLREFILGGVTRDLLNRTDVPVMLSH
jgi:nucleotide-binding universal stress UspA family protein